MMRKMMSAGWPALWLPLCSLLLAWPAGAAAQTASGKPPAKTSQAAPAAKPALPAKAGPSAYPAVPAGAGYRFAPLPDWVRNPPAASAAAPASLSGAKARRELLVDLQVQLGARDTQTFMRLHSVALDSSTLREVSEPQISFNPLYQTLMIHSASVLRGGQRSDRLKDARIELMRREQQLERQMIDGLRTALVVLSDVRVGDVVELAYTIAGENPIFENRYAALLQLAADAPIDRLHLRIEAPPQRQLATRAIAAELQPERFEEHGRQVLRLQRENVAAVQDEAGTPPWFKVYPALHVSEYGSWAEVNQWAQRLFAAEAKPAPAIAEQVAAIQAQQLTPEAQVAAALRFVQDEVRYFSASLGESSHRPKPASRTLAERLGDCKDKVQLLNALLGGLGFEAQPALVSMRRNRGIVNYLPAHDEFDHVITRVRIGEAVYFLDPTLNGQGLSLAKRGYYPYGQALVVGGPDALQPVVVPGFAEDQVSFRQDWDFSDLKQPARLTTSMRLRGLSAERWRASFASVGLPRIAESLAGAYVRQLPGLVSSGEPELLDDRASNELELRMHFVHPSMGRYQRGTLDLELSAMEIIDMLSVPPEARRRTPYMLDQPQQVELRLSVVGPRPFTAPAPPPQNVGDKHFSFQTRIELAGNKVTFVSRYERRSDEVLPADVEAFRERVARARQLSGNRLRLSLLDAKTLEPQFVEADRRLLKFRGARPDALLQILQANEFTRLGAGQVLDQLDPKSRLAAKVLTERAQANNLLGDFAAGLADAQAALAAEADGVDNGAALEARGVALIGLNRPAEALAAFEAMAGLPQQASAGSWLGSTHYLLGQYEQAERALRDSLANSGGSEREFGLLWLYLAAEQQGGRGRQAIAAELAGADAKQWPGALLSYLGGTLDREALLRVAREKPEQERLRLAEAYFFIGQQLVAQGRRGEAMPWFERTLSTQAVPYREFTLAQLELKRGAKP